MRGWMVAVVMLVVGGVLGGCADGAAVRRGEGFLLDGVPTCDVAAAHAAWREDPGGVQILDVRTPGEYVFVGHVPGARNIPWKLQDNRWDDQRKAPALRANAGFVAAVEKAYHKDDVILVMCRSGRRSADAVQALRAAGFGKTLSIDGGFEGEYGKPCDCPGREKLVKVGWKPRGYEWTFAVDPKLMWVDDK